VQAAIFIVFGVGLDDAFILFTAYTRTDPAVDVVERIRDTMDEVGISIFMTTATSVAAFALGCISRVPAIYWLCVYSSSTIAIDFIYQITFFIGLIVLDEVRIKKRRRDCLICYTVDDPEHDTVEGKEVAEVNGMVVETEQCNNAEISETGQGGTAIVDESEYEKDVGGQDESAVDNNRHLSARVMAFYADTLLIPWVKALVIISFAALLAACVYFATRLELKFDFTQVLPRDSYLIRLTDSINAHSQREGVSPFLYFRYVNQSDPYIHIQMEKFVDDIVAIDAITDPPFKFWLRDYKIFVAENEEPLRGLAFNDTLRLFLEDPRYNYEDSITLDESHNIRASRTQVHMDKINPTEIVEGLKALKDQRKVSSEQPINQNGGEWQFFTFEQRYQLWEFLLITPNELAQSTIIGIIAVSAMGILFMPHWSGVLFVGPLVIVLYVDLLGVLQLSGIDINGGKKERKSVSVALD